MKTTSTKIAWGVSIILAIVMFILYYLFFVKGPVPIYD